MGKIGVSATKYIIRAKIEATGVIEKPDVIGAIFGQTEGLLGKDLELRELQKGGRIGRIEVKVSSSEGKSTGVIEIPTSLSKEDTALIAAALETIERIGPSDSKIFIQAIEDIRTAKRDFVVDRAKALLAGLGQGTPGSTELSDKVKIQMRTGELKEYGPAKLAGGPDIEKEKDLILVEG
ncbi:MAG: DNA primase, partial [archaeon]